MKLASTVNVYTNEILIKFHLNIDNEKLFNFSLVGEFPNPPILKEVLYKGI